MTAAQGIDLRRPLASSPELNAVRKIVRSVVPELADDRYMAEDLRLAADLVSTGHLARAVSAGILPVLDS